MRGVSRHYIYCLIGKSGSGKDTVYKRLLEDRSLNFGHVVACTTRPRRAGEENGREYNFYTEEEFEAMLMRGAVIEYRCYQTVHGPWYYFTADDGQIDLSERSTLLIGTLESYAALRKWFADRTAGDNTGGRTVRPIYLEVEDGLRLQRLLDRERSQETPRYQEMCRRFLADSLEFDDEKIAEVGIRRRFVNDNLDACLGEVFNYIAETENSADIF